MSEIPVSNPSVDEGSLVERAQSGDIGAFDQLVMLHQQVVFAVALRMMGDYGEAEDIAQDAFVQAFKAIKSFRCQARLSTWLVSITINLCRNRRRWWARRKRVIVTSLDNTTSADEESPAYQVADAAPGPNMVVQRHEQKNLLTAALMQLDEAHRSIIVLRDVEGYSYEEIAHILGAQVGTVKSRINRARLQLRSLLDGKL